jgi:GT2 family glycosyltransferase
MKMYKAQRKGYKDDPNEWLVGFIIYDGERAYIHSPGSLIKTITKHYIYALCVEVEKESITPIEEEQ